MKKKYLKKIIVILDLIIICTFKYSCTNNKRLNPTSSNSNIIDSNINNRTDIKEEYDKIKEEYTKYNYKTYDDKAIKKLEALEIEIENQLKNGISNSFTVFDSEYFVITYESLWGIFTIGFDLMMLDLDYKDSEVGDNKETIIKKLEAYAKYNNIAFAYRESDRGIHAFLVSRKYDLNKDKDATKIMFENFCEDRYIIFSKKRNSYNVRIGPKPFEISSGRGPGSKLRTKDDLSKEFISKKPDFDILGDTKLVDPDLYKKLILHDQLVDMMYQDYQKFYDKVWNKTKHYQIHTEISNHIKNILVDKIKNIATKNGYPITGNYPCLYKGNSIY